MNNDYRSFIENTEFYRGQIVYLWERPQIPGTSCSIQTTDIRSFNPYSSFTNYFEHQRDLVNILKSGKNLLFLAPFNTGKTTIALLYALDLLFNDHKSVLIISANSFEKELEKKALCKVLIESKLNWLVDVHDIKEEINDEEYVGLFPSIYIIEARDLHWFLLPNHSKYSSLIESLGLVIYDDFEKFSGNLASNIHFINQRLEFIFSMYNIEKDLLQYLVLSKPFHESKRIVEGVFNKDFEIMYRDDKEINPAKVFYWIPAFDKVDIKYDQKKNTSIRTTQRDSFIDDTYILAIESLKKGRKTVVYYSNIPLSKDDIKTREVFINFTKRYGQIDLNAQRDFFIGYDWSDLTTQIIESGLDWEKIDTLIIALFSGSINDLRDYILHVGSWNSEIFITMPQTPSFQFELNHPGLEIRKDSKEIAKGESISVFAFSKGESLLKKHQLISTYEMRNFLDDGFREKFNNLWKLNGSETDVLTECETYTKKILAIKGFDIYSSEYKNFFTLLDSQGTIIGTVDIHELPDSYFKNAVICRHNERYKVDEIDLDLQTIKLLPLGEFSLTLSKREIKKISQTNIRNYKFSGIQFNVNKLNTNAKFNTYRVSTGTDPHPESFHLAGEDNLELQNFEIPGVEITGYENAESFANIFDISLNTKISLYNLTPSYFIYQGKSFFYNLGSDDLNYLINDAIIKDLLDRALSLMIDCPCQSGCAGCLENFKSENIDLSKKELIKFLGGLLNKTNLENILRWKYERVGEQGDLRKDMNKYRDIRNKIFEILNYKANLIIKEPYQEKFISADDEKWITSAGLCHEEYKTVYIKPGFNEANFTEICAHEYTHNWQNEGNLSPFFRNFNKDNIDDESNIWFEGKIFSEGQANYFSAKVMDYYGLREVVYSNEVQSYAQYREGLILLNYLEKKFGLTKLNFILREAKFENGSPVTLEDINNWYDESGVKSLIQGLADDLIKENMRCLQFEYLEKSRDYLRLTYFMNHQIDRRDKKLREYIKEAGISEDEAYSKIWEILKKHFNITPKKGYDYIPCKDCAYKDEESLEGLCMMFGSISVGDEIKKYLKIEN